MYELDLSNPLDWFTLILDISPFPKPEWSNPGFLPGKKVGSVEGDSLRDGVFPSECSTIYFINFCTCQMARDTL